MGISVCASTNADTFIYVGGVKHTLSVTIPANYDPLKSYPLIVGLHYCGGNSNEYRNALKPLCESFGAIIVCPDNNSAQMTNADFITASIDTAKSLYSINENEVYLTGMSCNGFETLQKGLNEIYPFKGIFPWAPWVTSFTSSTFNLDSKIPVVISIGTSDANYTTVIKLYESLVASNANVNLVLAQGIGHVLNFSGFSNEMTRCMKYVNDVDDISIDSVVDYTINNDAPALDIKVKIVHKADNDMTIRALSSLTSIVGNPEIIAIAGTDSVIVRIKPVAKATGKCHIIVEAAEDGGTAIEQRVFLVTVNAAATNGIHANLSLPLEIYPIPTNNRAYLKCSEKNISLQIINLNGQLVLSNNNFDTSSAIDVSELSKGIYFLKATNSKLNETIKFIKE